MPEINIVKSWRKSISMRFDRKWILQVKAPKFMLNSQIQTFLVKNKSWIEKHSAQLQERQQDTSWYLFGEKLTQSQLPANKFPLMEGDIHEVGGGVDTQELEKIYKTRAREYIKTRCQELAEKHWFTYKSIRITSAVTRWGSCSSQRSLNFSYRLIMAPKESIDYVIIHELCHLREMNHSARFWKQVSDIMPEYKEYEKHLKIDGWRYRIVCKN